MEKNCTLNITDSRRFACIELICLDTLCMYMRRRTDFECRLFGFSKIIRVGCYSFCSERLYMGTMNHLSKVQLHEFTRRYL